MNVLEYILLNLRKCDTNECEMKPNKFIFVLQLVISLLTLIQEQSEKHLTTLKLICGQLHLMTLRKPEYSTEFMVSSSLLHKT